MVDAKATICYLNGLSLRTINEVEKVLLALPKTGDRCEVKISKALHGEVGRSTGDVIASKSLQIRDEPRPFSLSPPEKSENGPSLKNMGNKPSVNISKAKRSSEYSCGSSSQEEVEKTDIRTNTSGASNASAGKKPVSRFECKVLTDQVRVSPIVSCNGVIIELDVEVTIPDREEKKKLKLEIECPDFVPSRIKIGNKWKNII